MFVGRKEELADLMTLWRKRTSSIVACRGRRRIGKSTLFREFARRSADVYIEIEGLAPQLENSPAVQDQLDHFIEVLSGLTGCDSSKVDNWFAAFSRLEKQIDDAKKTVILLDEISWMAGDDANFPGKFASSPAIHEISSSKITVFFASSICSSKRLNAANQLSTFDESHPVSPESTSMK